MLFLQVALYCLLFVLLVKCAAKSSGRNCLYFYPKEYLIEAQRRGIADVNAEMQKGKRFMLLFCAVMLAALILIVAVWNRAADFKTAYFQSLILLVCTNWFDGIAVDQLWVSRSKIRIVKGMEGVPYVKPWRTVIAKRCLATILYAILAFATTGISVWICRLCY